MLLGQLSQITAILFKCIIRVFGRITRHSRRTAHRRQCLQETVPIDTESAEQFLHVPVRCRQKAKHQMLNTDVFILHSFGFFGRLTQRFVHIRCYVDLALLSGTSRNTWKLFYCCLCRCAHGLRVDTHAGQQLRNKPISAFQQCGKQMCLGQFLIAIFPCKSLCGINSFNALLCILIAVHNTPSSTRSKSLTYFDLQGYYSAFIANVKYLN